MINARHELRSKDEEDSKLELTICKFANALCMGRARHEPRSKDEEDSKRNLFICTFPNPL